MGAKTQAEILALDPETNFLRHFDQDKLYEFIQCGMDAMTALIASVESFVNAVLPHDYTVSSKDKNGNAAVLSKDDIVRKFRIEEKIELLGELSKKTDFKQQTFWLSFKMVKKIRDDLIHFKNTGKKFNEIWDSILIALIDTDLEKASDDFVELIKYFRPAYFD